MFAFSLHCIFLICFSCFFVFNGCQLPCGVCRVGWSSGRECRLPLVIKRLPFNANCCFSLSFSLFLSFSLGNLLSAIELFADNSVYPEGKLNVGERAMVCPSWRTVPNYGMVCALFIVLNSGVLHMGLMGSRGLDGKCRMSSRCQKQRNINFDAPKTNSTIKRDKLVWVGIAMAMHKSHLTTNHDCGFCCCPLYG